MITVIMIGLIMFINRVDELKILENEYHKEDAS